MSRLNLDAFTAPADNNSKAEQKEPAEAIDPEIPPEIPKSPKQSSRSLESPKFVPVGFLQKDLWALDQAVLNLRRAGHWQASKSGIIRAMIHTHRGDLERVWKEASQ